MVAAARLRFEGSALHTARPRRRCIRVHRSTSASSSLSLRQLLLSVSLRLTSVMLLSFSLSEKSRHPGGGGGQVVCIEAKGAGHEKPLAGDLRVACWVMERRRAIMFSMDACGGGRKKVRCVDIRGTAGRRHRGKLAMRCARYAQRTMMPLMPEPLLVSSPP